MVESALPLQQALNMLVLKTEYNKPKGVRLQRYQLSANEWDLLKQLHPLLDVCLSLLKLQPTNILSLGVPYCNKEDLSEQGTPYTSSHSNHRHSQQGT